MNNKQETLNTLITSFVGRCPTQNALRERLCRLQLVFEHLPIYNSGKQKRDNEKRGNIKQQQTASDKQ
jgi:hypothetical protein